MFTDQSILITGGSSGIGRATALAFARAGAHVTIADIDTDGAHETIRQAAGTAGEIHFIQADMRRAEDVARMVESVITQSGKLDCAVNNAGVFSESGRATDITEAMWDDTIDTNLKGVWLCMKYEIPHMLERGGSIVNLTSVLGMRGAAEATAYSASKHGVIGLTKSAAIAYAQQNVRINAIAPGIIHTPMEQPVIDNPELYAELMALYPMRRVGQPNEAAQVILWLCSDAASYITGAILPVDGGHMAF